MTEMFESISDECMGVLVHFVKELIKQEAGGDPVLAMLMRKELAASLRESARKELAAQSAE
jgi:hypothetical protein